MAERRQSVRVVATHRYVRDPEAAERAVDLWARYLAERVAVRAAEAAPAPVGPFLGKLPG